MGTCSSVRQWQPGQRRSGLGKEARQGSLRRGQAHPVGDASGECTWGPRGSVVDEGPLRGVGWGGGGRSGDEKWAGSTPGRRTSHGAAHLTGLCSVATGSGLSWDSGAAARLGESPASIGNLRPCGGSWALMSRTRGALRGEGRSRHSWPPGVPSLHPPRALLLTCRRPRPVPGWKQLPEPWPREDAPVQEEPGRCLRRVRARASRGRAAL